MQRNQNIAKSKAMKCIAQISFIIWLLVAFTISAQAQTSHSKNSSTSKPTSNPKTGTQQDTTVKAPKTKLEKTVDQGNAYLKMADNEKSFFKTLFPSKKGDTVYAVIAGIDYKDPNLKILKQRMDNVKNTKGLTSGYHHGTVVIKILYKDGDASNLYDSLDDDIKQLFEVEDMEGCRMILSYKMAKPVSSN
jgi:hypothetical protein